MCDFCTQHGDGKKWYLEASTYAADLSADIERRGYLINFVQGFDARATRSVRMLDILGRTPKSLADIVRTRASENMKRDHFGQPLPIEDCERVLDIATSVVQLPCVCRHFAGAPEEGYCLAITTRPVDDVLAEAFRDFSDGPDTARFQRLTKEEALAVLRRTEREGLMHSVWTFKTPFIAAICNCNLASGCMAMRMTLGYGVKLMWRGEYVASVDAETCTGCSACVAKCPFSAIDFDGAARRASVRSLECWGCGTCRAACRAGAISLADRAAVPSVASVW
jgi:Na+-translocating ferredoxin:NAD+ oxidoreductase RNF subunit RnfB